MAGQEVPVPEKLRVLDLFSGIPLAASVSGSSEPEASVPLPSARSSPTAVPSSQSTGRTSPATRMSGRYLPLQPMLFAQDSPVSPEAPQPVDETRAASILTGSGRRCLGLFNRAGPVGSLVRTLLTSTSVPGWRWTKWYLIWRPSVSKSRRLLKFRLVPSDTITGARASGLSATPTETANQSCPSMQKWPGCRSVDLRPEVLERRMGYPVGWTDIGEAHSAMPSSRRSRKPSAAQSSQPPHPHHRRAGNR